MDKHKDKKDNFSVFENYKCDGQLTLQFTEDGVKIVEDIEKQENIEIGLFDII